MIVIVDTARRLIDAGGEQVPCRIGRGGAVAASNKREGDGATPLGRWPVRAVLIRPDKGFVPPDVEWRYIRRWDGWCDDPNSTEYNRPIALPAAASAETLWRDDDRYDAIVVLGYNDDLPIAGAGSAIFCHVAGPGDTEGCVALRAKPLAALLSKLRAGSSFEII